MLKKVLVVLGVISTLTSANFAAENVKELPMTKAMIQEVGEIIPSSIKSVEEGPSQYVIEFKAIKKSEDMYGYDLVETNRFVYSSDTNERSIEGDVTNIDRMNKMGKIEKSDIFSYSHYKDMYDESFSYDEYLDKEYPKVFPSKASVANMLFNYVYGRYYFPEYAWMLTDKDKYDEEPSTYPLVVFDKAPDKWH